jgi:hypothetical protein
MPWRDVQGLHIYCPPARLQNNWHKEIIGKVIKPIAENYSIRWMWITRYLQPVVLTPHLFVPNEYQFFFQHAPDIPHTAFTLFRLSVEDKSAQRRAIELVQSAGYYTQGWVDYDVVADLGKDRFIRSDANETERIERAHQIAVFMSATSTLIVHSLKEENGEWYTEANSDKANNPDGSFFQSVHHLFCNATEVPLFVEVKAPSSNVRAKVQF